MKQHPTKDDRFRSWFEYWQGMDEGGAPVIVPAVDSEGKTHLVFAVAHEEGSCRPVAELLPASDCTDWVPDLHAGFEITDSWNRAVEEVFKVLQEEEFNDDKDER